MVPPPAKAHIAGFVVIVLLTPILLFSMKLVFLLFSPLNESLAMQLAHGQISLLVFFIYIMAGSLAVGGLCGIPMYLLIRRWGRKYRRFDRWRRQRCTECDYDLRAHAGGGTCPECAAPIPKKYQPPNPVPPPQRPRSLWLTIPLLVLPVAAMFWIAPILEDWQVVESIGLLAMNIYTSAVIYVIIRNVNFHRWRNVRCTHCRCDLRAHLAAAEGPAICPQCGTPVPAPSATIPDQRSRP